MPRSGIVLQDFNMGGLSDSLYRGIENSLFKMVGWDLHSEPGLLKVNQAMVKHSSTVVTELCKEKVVASNGITYWFSSESGKVWQDKNGTYTLVYTTSPTAGAAICLGAAEYQGYIIWATQSRLHRIAVASADGAANWTANATANWQTLPVTNTMFHPMREANLVLYIGDGYQLHQVDGTTFTANALDLPTRYKISAIAQVPGTTEIVLGTYIASDINDCSVFRWNTWGDSWYPEDSIPEPGVYAFLEADNYLLCFAGLSGSVYWYNREQMKFFRRIPGIYSPTAQNKINPAATAMFKGSWPIFGVSNVQGNPSDQGIFSLGAYDPAYRTVLNLEWPIPEVDGDGYNYTDSVEIGAIAVRGVDLYMSYKRGSAVGIAKIDYSNKIAQPYLQSRIIGMDKGQRSEKKTFSKLRANYASLPDGTSIVLKRKVNHSASFETLSQRINTEEFVVGADKDDVDAFVYEARVECVCSGNDAPTIETIDLDVK